MCSIDSFSGSGVSQKCCLDAFSACGAVRLLSTTVTHGHATWAFWCVPMFLQICFVDLEAAYVMRIGDSRWVLEPGKVIRVYGYGVSRVLLILARQIPWRALKRKVFEFKSLGNGLSVDGATTNDTIRSPDVHFIAACAAAQKHSNTPFGVVFVGIGSVLVFAFLVMNALTKLT